MQAPNIYNKGVSCILVSCVVCVSGFIRLCSIVMYLSLADKANQRLIVLNICHLFKEVGVIWRLKIVAVVCMGNVYWMKCLISFMLSVSSYLNFYLLGLQL